MKAIALLSLVALPLLAGTVHASERATVCAKYAVNYGWSSGYKVEATIARGNELNQSTHTLNYNGLSTYVVIFWAQDQASVIEMSFPYLGPVEQEGTDQEGKRWTVAKSNFCM
ncbi:hypothetical protein [Rhodanobacter thiooxydans]|uniref:hypothetical protein n=1 Tax=Rhodanobacter thiooxydans TaxID=416169 RepID=UPI000D3A54FB|nr:hypothetical protein [Rhodanobacter thiooxydans]